MDWKLGTSSRHCLVEIPVFTILFPTRYPPPHFITPTLPAPMSKPPDQIILDQFCRGTAYTPSLMLKFKCINLWLIAYRFAIVTDGEITQLFGDSSPPGVISSRRGVGLLV